MTLQLKLDIAQLLTKGSHKYQKNDYEAALRLYYKAWIKLPKPPNEQEQAGQILILIGDCYFQLGRYEPAIEALRSALDIPDMNNNPTPLLRLGQCLLDNGQEVSARTYLQRAYRIGGADLFNIENQRYIMAITDLVA